METLTHTRKARHMLLAVLTAFMLVLAIAPSADAQTRESTKQGDTATLAATTGCPDGFVEGRFGCMPENLTTKPDTGDTGNDCPDKWVPSSAPGGCSPGFFTIAVGAFDFDNGCPDMWVPSSAPGGCSPDFLTLKTAGLDATLGCPDMWVPSSAPGGCSPGFIAIDSGGRVFEAQYHCAFGRQCDAMVEAIIALGGSCTSSSLGETCTIPTGPPGRD